MNARLDSRSVEAELRVDYRRLAARVLAACVAIEVLLLVCDYHLSYGGLVDVGAVRRLFNLAREDGLGSWFQATQTFVAALTLWFIYVVVRARRGGRFRVVGFLVLACFFTYMAVDDGAQLHERAASLIDATEGRSVTIFFPSYTWQILFLPVFAAMGVFLLVFLWRELGILSSRVVLLLSLACLVTAVGLDFVEGLSMGDRLNVLSHAARESASLRLWSATRFGAPAYDTLQHFARSTEETLEMVSISVLWSLFIGHLSIVAPDVRIRHRSRS